MLTKQHKTKVNYISRLLVLPVALLVFAAFTLKAKTYTEKNKTGKTITVVIDAKLGFGPAGKGCKVNLACFYGRQLTCYIVIYLRRRIRFAGNQYLFARLTAHQYKQGASYK